MEEDLKPSRGRKCKFEDKFAVSDALVSITKGTFSSRYLALKLVEMKLVQVRTENRKGRGRPRVFYEITDEGRELIDLAKNDKREAG